MSTALIKTPSVTVSEITPAPEATKRRDELLVAASEVTTITDRLDADSALATLKDLTAFRNEIESGRKTVKAPFKEVADRIDALASELSSAIIAERDRISALLGTYEEGERQKAEEAAARAREAAAKIARDAEKAAIEAARSAKDDESRARAVDAVVEQSQAKLAEVKQVAINAQRPKSEGASLRTNIEFEVTDIKELYAAYPELVVLEPNKAAIKAILKTNPNLQVPGLKHWTTKKLSA